MSQEGLSSPRGSTSECLEAAVKWHMPSSEGSTGQGTHFHTCVAPQMGASTGLIECPAGVAACVPQLRGPRERAAPHSAFSNPVSHAISSTFSLVIRVSHYVREGITPHRGKGTPEIWGHNHISRSILQTQMDVQNIFTPSQHPEKSQPITALARSPARVV